MTSISTRITRTGCKGGGEYYVLLGLSAAARLVCTKYDDRTWRTRVRTTVYRTEQSKTKDVDEGQENEGGREHSLYRQRGAKQTSNAFFPVTIFADCVACFFKEQLCPPPTRCAVNCAACVLLSTWCCPRGLHQKKLLPINTNKRLKCPININTSILQCMVWSRINKTNVRSR